MKKLLLTVILLPLSGYAVDGVREINQICANNFGCFAGDSGGFPVTITSAGSYRLTSDLNVSAVSNPENRIAVDISSNNVTLDLNGFSITGPVSCSGTPVTSCTPAGGTGDGVRTMGSAQDVTIRDGHIRGMGRAGVNCTGGCRVENIVATENRSTGIGNSNNFGWFVNNIVRRNGGDGFFVAGHVEGNISYDNGGRGIFVNPNSIVTSNQSINNGGDGIRCFSCTLLDNIVSSNTGFGVDFGGNSVYGRNLIDNNDMGEIDGTAFAVDANRCGFVACP